MFIGIISDTHGVFSQEFKDFLSPTDQIWHAGDFGGSINFVDEIAAFKPLVGVYGNCDGQDVRLTYPEYQCFECEGQRVDRYSPDIFVCGHSHILMVKNDESRNLLYINPGACGLQGWQVERTALRVHIEDGKIFGMELFREPRTLQTR